MNTIDDSATPHLSRIPHACGVMAHRAGTITQTGKAAPILRRRVEEPLP
jgi:hypothetical protein